MKISKLDTNNDGLNQARAVIDEVFEPVTDLNEVEDDGLPF